MPSFDITDRIPEHIGLPASTSATWKNTGFIYDWAIAGLPFLAANSKDITFERYTSPIRKQQFDTTQEVGEQSLEGWWIRSQSTFHGGAGMLFLDSTINGGIGRYLDQSSGAEDGRRFYKSAGVDVWTPGTVTLLPQTNVVRAASGSCQVVGGTSSGTDVFWQNNAGSVTRETGSSSTSITGFANLPQWIASTGGTVLAGHVTGIDSFSSTGTTASPLWTQASGTAPTFWWVKQRLITARGQALYELPLTGGNLDAATPIYTQPVSGWTWSAAVDAPASILVAGYAGSQSAIYKFVLDTTTGAVPILTGATISASLPEGEIVQSMYCYLGTYLAIGTNRGVRIGIIDTNGDVTYGPLSVFTTSPVTCFTGKDRFIYFGYTAGIDGVSGVGRLDLSIEVSSGRYGWASDLQAAGSTAVQSMCQLGNTSQIVMGLTSAGSYLQHATQLVPSGYIQTAYVRYGTLEPKLFKLVRARFAPLQGDLVISMLDRSGVNSSLYTVPSGTSAADEVGITYPPAELVALKFQLNRNATDATLGANLASYQLKALPATPRREIIKIPLLCFDHEEDRNSRQGGGIGTAKARYLALRDATMNGDAYVIQDLNTGESVVGVIEELHFNQTGDPGKKSSFGGVLVATVRTV